MSVFFCNLLCFVAGNRRKLLKFLSVQSVSYGIQFMLKLVKLDTLDLLSTSTTVSFPVLLLLV